MSVGGILFVIKVYADTLNLFNHRRIVNLMEDGEINGIGSGAFLRKSWEHRVKDSATVLGFTKVFGIVSWVERTVTGR